METVPNHSLVHVRDEEMKKTREFFELNDVKQIQESLDAVRQWLERQPHLAEAGKNISPASLERLYIIARGSVEATKLKIEKLLTKRGMMPELCLNRTVKEFDTMFDWLYYLPLPKLNTDLSRVMVTKFLPDKLDEFNLLTYFRYCFMIGEYRLNYDYTISERYIVDLENASLGYLTKLNPIVLKKAEILCVDGFGTKISGIHILNAPAYVDKFIHLLKSALSEKVSSRVHVHNTYKDLHSHISKEILPKDYDGDEQSCEKLAEQWRDLLKSDDVVKIMAESEKMVSNESRRDTATFNQDYMGMPGSFRKLNVD